MLKLLRRLRDSDSGASAAEYALIVAVIGAGVILATTGLGTSISGALTRSSTTLDGV